MSQASGAWAVGGGTTASGDIGDVEGLSPAELAERVEDLHDGISLCHQCAHRISDLEVSEMTWFEVDGVEYERVDGEWRVAQ